MTIRRLEHLALALALILLAICLVILLKQRAPTLERPKDKHVVVKADLKEDGTLEIDETFHDTELLRPGDNISFVCDCDEGLEFTVTEPVYALDLHALHHLIDNWEGETHEIYAEKLDSLRAAVGRARERLESHDSAGQNGVSHGGEESIADPRAVSPAAEVHATTEGAGQFLRLFLDPFEHVVREEPGERLVSDWRDPDFRPGGERIGPFVVRSSAQESKAELSLWKFTWKVRVQGDPSRVDEWDPDVMRHSS